MRVRSDVAEAMRVSQDKVRVIVPDTGGGFGGKHTGEVAVEAARLAKAAARPVRVNWTREEEFTWAYFRPAGVIEIEAGLDPEGRLTAWDFTNYNSGSSAIESPYEIANQRTRFVRSDSPLREGSYRALAATANNFARESFMDELAAAAGTDPLDFRLRHLANDRLRAVLQRAAQRFDWKNRVRSVTPKRSVGLACGTEKGSYVASCVEVEVDQDKRRIKVLEVCEAFECGPILNPSNLRAQVEGCIVMGLGGALREKIEFENGKVLNPLFSRYAVPRFEDTPKIHTELLKRPDLPSVGAGETPIIAIAPAIANAVCLATGTRIRSMPLEGWSPS
jgi:isoquinoline 1-oxidoreductase